MARNVAGVSRPGLVNVYSLRTGKCPFTVSFPIKNMEDLSKRLPEGKGKSLQIPLTIPLSEYPCFHHVIQVIGDHRPIWPWLKLFKATYAKTPTSSYTCIHIYIYIYVIIHVYIYIIYIYTRPSKYLTKSIGISMGIIYIYIYIDPPST